MNKRTIPTDDWKSETMVELRRRAGWDGQARYNLILDLIAEQMTPGDPPSLEMHEHLWREHLATKTPKLNTLLKVCRDLKLLNCGRSRNVLRISSPKLLSQLSEYHKKSGQYPVNHRTPDHTRIPGSPGERCTDPAIKKARAQATRVFNRHPGWTETDVVALADQLPDQSGDRETRGTLLLVGLRKELEHPSDDPRSRRAEKYFVGMIGTRVHAIPDTDRQRFKALAYGASRTREPEPHTPITGPASSNPFNQAMTGLTSSQNIATAPAADQADAATG